MLRDQKEVWPKAVFFESAEFRFCCFFVRILNGHIEPPAVTLQHRQAGRPGVRFRDKLKRRQINRAYEQIKIPKAELLGLFFGALFFFLGVNFGEFLGNVHFFFWRHISDSAYRGGESGTRRVGENCELA